MSGSTYQVPEPDMQRRPLSIRLTALASVAVIAQPGPRLGRDDQRHHRPRRPRRDHLRDTINGGDDNDVLPGHAAAGNSYGVTIRRISTTAPNAKGLQTPGQRRQF